MTLALVCTSARMNCTGTPVRWLDAVVHVYVLCIPVVVDKILLVTGTTTGRLIVVGVPVQYSSARDTKLTSCLASGIYGFSRRPHHR
jgi:hypothetical protein